MDALISVIVPVYNMEKYLVECVESIRNQTLKEIEVILVDDGSVDKSGAICDRYTQTDSRVKVIHQENRGLMAARYRGIMESACPYITFVDADDFIERCSYELALESMGRGIDLIVFGIIRYYDARTQKKETGIFNERIYNRQEIEELIYPKMIWDMKTNRFGLDPALWNKVMKRELVMACYRRLAGKNFYYGEDTAITYPMVKRAETIEIRQQPYYYHRQRKRTEIPEYIADKAYFEKLYMLYKYLAEQFCDDKRLIRQIEYFYMHSVELRKHAYGDYQKGTQYLFPFDKVGKGDRIIIYGAGLVGHSYMEQLGRLRFCQIALWVDKNFQNFTTEDISPIEKIRHTLFDKLVIAVEGMEINRNIRQMLVDMGVDAERIISAFW